MKAYTFTLSNKLMHKFLPLVLHTHWPDYSSALVCIEKTVHILTDANTMVVRYKAFVTLVSWPYGISNEAQSLRDAFITSGSCKERSD